ncbi:MAG: dihydropteroate synthase [Clostridia bacterium]|nr:dihydropteroate synthase [Clostridia bacterium]
MRSFSYASGSLALGEKTYIMGILNITPDSFYDAGRFFDPVRAIERAVGMMEEGADIIDIGAVSTRPGADRADEEEELRRLKSVFAEIRKNVRIPISVDTYRPDVARWCLDNGADIINDVSGEFNAETARFIKEYGAGWILMHSGESGAKTEDVLGYPLGIVNHVQLFFDKVTAKAEEFGISASRLCLDPGFGFAKTASQNTELLRSFDMLKTGECAIMCALSRKRFIGELFNEKTADDREAGTVAADICAVLKGADILRVHDVSAHKKVICGIDKLAR